MKVNTEFKAGYKYQWISGDISESKTDYDYGYSDEMKLLVSDINRIFNATSSTDFKPNFKEDSGNYSWRPEDFLELGKA